tara:strand:- start:137 stop:451 length:315 start_codon:yes stop_codon:yes gene_type:complete
MENILLDIGGKEFYFDMDSLSHEIKVENNTAISDDTIPNEENKMFTTLQIDVAKYEMYRDMVNTLLSCNEIIDDKLGFMGLNSLSIPFKLSFNTLLVKGIIKEL